MLKSILTFAIVCALLAVQGDRPERKVEGNTVVSDHDPRVAITLPRPVQYVGADRWHLYDIADCELHVFVEADAQKHVQRLYWVQFEGFLPSKPETSYRYNSPQHATIGEWDFYVDTWVRASGAPTRAGSDREHVEALIAAKGYNMPAGTMYVRLVHLLDQQRRRELMIIYGEDLAPTGFTAADLDQGGSAFAKWARSPRGWSKGPNRRS